jgi:hypothetical protein
MHNTPHVMRLNKIESNTWQEDHALRKRVARIARFRSLNQHSLAVEVHDCKGNLVLALKAYPHQ